MEVETRGFDAPTSFDQYDGIDEAICLDGGDDFMVRPALILPATFSGLNATYTQDQAGTTGPTSSSPQRWTLAVRALVSYGRFLVVPTTQGCFTIATLVLARHCASLGSSAATVAIKTLLPRLTSPLSAAEVLLVRRSIVATRTGIARSTSPTTCRFCRHFSFQAHRRRVVLTQPT